MEQMVDNALIYFNLILACTLALCCVEIYIKINSYWLAIKFIPLFPKLFSLVLLSLPVSNHCLSALWGISRKPPNFLPLLGLHQLLGSSANRLSSKSGRKWVTADQIPIVSLVMVGWREKPLKREIFPKDVCEVKKSMCLFESLQNGFDTEPSHCDHQS